MGFRKKLKKLTGKARSITDKVTPHQLDKVSREVDRLFNQGYVAGRVTSDPLGAVVHEERTRDGGTLNDSPLEEDEEEIITEAAPVEELVDEEAARKARRRSRARQRSGRSSTILTGGSDMGGGSDALGGG